LRRSVVGALKGAAVGGGLELASAFHIRVAYETTYFALPATDAFFAETFVAGITNTQEASKERLAAFSNKTDPKTLKA
jgi:hypothetical protein